MATNARYVTAYELAIKTVRTQTLLSEVLPSDLCVAF